MSPYRKEGSSSFHRDRVYSPNQAFTIFRIKKLCIDASACPCDLIKCGYNWRILPNYSHGMAKREQELGQAKGELYEKSEETKKAQASIELLRVELHTFLNENPGTKIEERDGEIIIANPWCDETVPLKIDIKSDSLIKALNSVVLPPRLRAIYHKDSRDLEIIYTPFPIDSDIAKRSFEFRFGGKRYRCEFAKSSDILLQIATAFIPAAPPSNTDYRNLQSSDTMSAIRERTARRPGHFLPNQFASGFVRLHRARMNL